jgi:TolB-like protein/class 3 adenylate cyclase/Flp pilus assembly protein TadD
MSSQAITRRLVAIVSVDVAGYSRLMAADELGTLQRLNDYREFVRQLVRSHGGRVVDNPGDNALLEFPTASSAVECAMQIQAEVELQNRELAPDRRMEFRIGIHLGEVMAEGERIYGDGVNIAARLEAMADVGGICVSKAVRDQVVSRIEADLEDLGEKELKNIRDPIRVFRVGSHAKKVLVSVAVAGFADLLEQDAVGALSSLKAHRIAADPLVLSHGGRVLETYQHRVLYEFPDAGEAMRCAAEAQALMAGRNSTVPPERRMQFKIGIHLANIPEAHEGVEAIQEAAEPGKVVMSDAVYREIKSEVEGNFVKSGATSHGHPLWTIAPEIDTSARPTLRGGPGSLLVLPFERLGNDPDQDYLVDGITDDLISAISEYGEVRVVPRSSAFAYRDSALSERDIARQLDAVYILRGSVRATPSRVRVTVELVEAESGEALWSERFDRDYEDVLDLQDEIAYSITTTLVPAVRQSELSRSLSQPGNVEHWSLVQRAKWHYYQATRDDFDKAVGLYEKSIEMDPTNGEPYSWLCLVLITRIWHGWSPDIPGDFHRIKRLAAEGIRLDAGDWRAHHALAVYYMFQTKDFDRALAEARHGERFEPMTLGAVYLRMGEHELAIELAARDLQINPNRPDRYHVTTNLAQSHYMLGKYEAARAWAERSLELNPRYIQAVGYLAASLAQLGRLDEARTHMDRFLEHFSGMTAAKYKTRFNFKNEADVDHYMEGLIKAGMPAGNTSPSQRAVWIAVLPFENIGNDPEQEYFADGITEDVINGLSAYHSLRVIARSSSFQFRGSELSPPEIAERLDVQYLLEGSVRVAENRARVTAQLIESPDSHHIWADRYEADLDDIFEAQDRITSSIVGAIDPAIRVEHATRSPTKNLEAWDHVQRGWYEIAKTKRDSYELGLSHFRQAIGLDPQYAEAYARAGNAIAIAVWLRWSDNPDNDLEIAEGYAKRAIELDERDATGHQAMSMVAYAQGRMVQTVREADRAIQLNPSNAAAHMLAAVGRIHGGDPDAGIPFAERAMELSPKDPSFTWFQGSRAIGHLLAGNYDEAVSDAKAAIATRYGYLFGRVMLIVALVQLGRIDEAQAEMRTLLEIDPEFSAGYLARYTFSDEQREMFEVSLHEAGLGR